MKVVKGSDWLQSQEEIARRKVLQLQKVPATRTVTETVEKEVPVR